MEQIISYTEYTTTFNVYTLLFDAACWLQTAAFIHHCKSLYMYLCKISITALISFKWMLMSLTPQLNIHPREGERKYRWNKKVRKRKVQKEVKMVVTVEEGESKDKRCNFKIKGGKSSDMIHHDFFFPQKPAILTGGWHFIYTVYIIYRARQRQLEAETDSWTYRRGKMGPENTTQVETDRQVEVKLTVWRTSGCCL